MKITLIGYGKMGKIIERLATGKGHEISHRFSSSNIAELSQRKLQESDVAIEFTRPERAFDNISACLEAGIPVVSGTTGWTERLRDVKNICEQTNGTLLYASNFSVGVNIFFAINRYLAAMMAKQQQYNACLEEIHHTQKLDYPSGTAITLAQGIIKENSRYTSYVSKLIEGEDDTAGQVPASALSISSRRLDKVPGTHSIDWDSAIDSIQITHTAHSREGFASGALHAAEWVIGKKGFFEMKDMLGF